jgi:hypothetical protein
MARVYQARSRAGFSFVVCSTILRSLRDEIGFVARRQPLFPRNRSDAIPEGYVSIASVARNETAAKFSASVRVRHSVTAGGRRLSVVKAGALLRLFWPRDIRPLFFSRRITSGSTVYVPRLKH